MNLISLISDRKPGDFFIGRAKGYMYKNIENVNIIDFALGVENFNINSGAFILRNGLYDFPENTVHIIGIDSELTDKKELLVAKAANQYFITADNGIISLVFNENEIDEIIRIKTAKEYNYRPSLFYFVDAAKKILLGEKLSNIGIAAKNYKKKILFNPSFKSNFISGNIIYFDNYENAVTNISIDLFETVGKGRKFIIYAGSKKDYVKVISSNYDSVENGEILAIFNSYKLLEIAIFRGNIKTLFNLNNNSIIRIEFYD